MAGYYPFPATLLPALASGFSLGCGATYGPPCELLDPCAGDGAAILGLAEALAGSDTRWGAASARVTAIELEGDRAERLRENLRERGAHLKIEAQAFQGDALTASIGEGFDLLYLNPPYDSDSKYGRLELRFLEKLTPVLRPGCGWLLFVVPLSAMTARMREALARHFTDVELRRFPDEEFRAFRQVVVRARRRVLASDSTDVATDSLLRAAAAGDLAGVPDIVAVPFSMATLSGSEGACTTVEIQDVDLEAIVETYSPWLGQERLLGLDRPLDHLHSSPQRITLPPKPAHLALALSTGLLNGQTLEADRPDLFPRILVKGALVRSYEYLKSSRREDGSIASAQYTQVPHLVLNVLRLDTRSLVTLHPGGVPTGARDLAEWNTADLALQYSGSLRRVLKIVLPALHDPSRAGRSVPYPALDRKLFAIQDAALQASLKLLASGETPLLLGEVGTGKSTVALTLARLLEPENFAATRASLERLGFPARRHLRPVRAMLILCPTHLVSSWQEQIAAVRPWARVQVLEKASDVAPGADIYLLSRETAKLDAKIVGLVGSRCPRCGRLGDPEARDPQTRADRRYRCDNLLHPDETRHPLLDPLIGLTLQVAGLLSFAGAGSLARLVGRRVSGFSGGRIAHAAELDERARAAILHAADERVGKLVEGLSNLPNSHLYRADLDAFRGALESCRYRDSRHGTEKLEGLLFKLLHRFLRDGQPGEGRRCNEPFFSRLPSPRRTPLARHVLRRLKGRVDLLVIDEAQEYGHGESAQARAAWRLVSLGCPTILLSGSIMNGYSSSLFPALWATRKEFRAHFERSEEHRFVEQYGYQRLSLQFKPGSERQVVPQTLGSSSDAILEGADGQRVQEAPGVTPQLLVRHLMPVAIPMHKQDLDEALPELDEIPVGLTASGEAGQRDLDSALLKGYEEVTQRVIAQLAADKDDEARRGALWGAFAQLVFAPELAAEDCGPYEVRYPERLNRELVATMHPFPADEQTPKERWLVKKVASELAEERPVIVFLQSSGHGRFVERLAKLLETVAPRQVIALDAQRVDAKRRKAWIDKYVNDAGKRVLIVNPSAIKTGLNNLVRFRTAIWYQIPDFNVLVTRQANGRLHRIGQKYDVRIYYPFYEGTLQEAAMTLVSRKMSASLQVDGLSLQSALEVAGAGGGDERAANSFSFGEALARLYTSQPTVAGSGALLARQAVSSDSAGRAAA